MIRPKIKYLRQEEKYDSSKRDSRLENFYEIEYGDYCFQDVKATELHDCEKCKFSYECSYKKEYADKRYLIPGDICLGDEVERINVIVIAIGIVSDILGLMFLYLNSDYLIALGEFIIVTVLLSALGVMGHEYRIMRCFNKFIYKLKNRQNHYYEVIEEKIKSSVKDAESQKVYLDSLKLVKKIETISQSCSFDKSEDEYMVQIIDLAKKVVCISALRNISIDKISEQIFNFYSCIYFYFCAQQLECLDDDYERLLEIALSECLDFLKSQDKKLKNAFMGNADFS